MKALVLVAAAAVALALAALGCVGAAPDSRPIDKRISMPVNPVLDARAREILAKRVEVLAERVELYLPPALYSELQCIPQLHTKDEFDTAAGRRVTLRPPAQGAPPSTPARVHVGSWRLAARGKIDVLFSAPAEGPAVRLRAYGVDLFFRDPVATRGVPEVDVDDDQVRTPGMR